MKIGNAKKITALLLALLLAMAALAGCGSGDNTGDDQDGQGDQQGQQEQQNGETGGDTSLQDILDQGEISVAISPDYAPYEYLDLASGEVKGSDIELAKYIAKELGVTLKIEQMNFESCLAAVQAEAATFRQAACPGRRIVQNPWRFPNTTIRMPATHRQCWL